MYLTAIKLLSSRSSRLRQNQTMSKAFTKETDADHDEPPALLALPVGSKNYITPQGYARMRSELFELIDNERPKIVEVVHWAASNGDRSENGDLHRASVSARAPLAACPASQAMS